MRLRNISLVILFALSVSLAFGCSKDTATTATGPAPDATGTTSTTATPDTSTEAVETGTSVASTTTTAKKPVTTKKAAPVTTAKPTPPTTKAIPTTTAFAVPTTPPTTRGAPAPPEFCAWVELIVVEDKTVPFQQYIDTRYQQTVDVGPFVPGELREYYDALMTAAEQIKPVVDSGEVYNTVSASQWYVRHIPEVYDKIIEGAKVLGTYRHEHC